MEEIKQCMKQVADYIDQVAGVIDAEGEVLASTDPMSLGTRDFAALSFLTRDVQRGVEDQRSYRRLSLPNGQEYVCFVDGTDAVAGSYVDLISAWIMAACRDNRGEEERVLLLKNILLENELPGDIPLKAREFQIAYAALRIVYVIHVESGDHMECMAMLKHMFPNRKADFLFNMDEQSIVLIKELAPDEGEDFERYAKEIRDTLSTESMAKVRVGIGMPVEILKDCAKSYREASLAITIGGIFEKENDLIRYDKLGLGRLIYQLPPTLCQMFLSEVFPPGSYEQLDQETLKTIQMFFQNNLNGSETSRQLFVHRNTLVYRLDKVQKITNLDLRSFDDAVLFKLASMVRQYLEKQNAIPGYKRRQNNWWRA